MNFTRTMNNKNEDLINKIVNLMQADDSADAPADAVEWSNSLFRARRAAEPKKSMMQKIMAVLQMDLSLEKTVSGERSASDSAARQMLFAAGDNGLDLRITKINKGFKLTGQILGEGFVRTFVGL